MNSSILRRSFLWAGIVLAALPVLAISAVASAHSQAVSSTPNVVGTFKDGPYASTTPDSGTCGNNWAIDLFTRQFVIFPENLDGSWTVVEKFNNGRFITLGDGGTSSGPSPVACPTGPNSNNGHLLKEGISGTFSGSFTISIPAGFSYTSNQGCGSPETTSGQSIDDGCTTKGWVDRAFVGATYSIPVFSFTYKALGSGLIGTTWTNASAGNSGDIYTS